MNLFIDTNVFLAFYDFSGDDLEELRLIRNGRAMLILPEQVHDEFRRNRESQISGAVSVLRKQTLNLQFPVICREYPEYEELRKLQRSYQTAHQSLLDQLLEDGREGALKADEVISDLFASAQRVHVSDAVFGAAQRRVALGNPPGKKGSLGDAINWEVLLSVVGPDEPLCFVSDDGDFSSELDRGRFDPYLSEEWFRTKEGEFKYFKRLSDFFADCFPTIRLAGELEKELLIADLANSHAFSRTHEIVAKLLRFTEFSIAQRNDLLDAFVGNNQVYWIISDADVSELLQRVVNGYEDRLEKEKMEELRRILDREETQREATRALFSIDDDSPA